MYFEEVSGKGNIFSYIVVRQALVPGRIRPMSLGSWSWTNSRASINAVIDADPMDVRIGQRVRLRIVDLRGSDYRVPEFVVSD